MHRFARTLLLTVVAALLATLMPSQPAEAQANVVTETIIAPDSGRVWKAHRDGIEQGLAWRDPAFDDSAWEDATMKFYELHGTVVGNGYHGYYFREEVDITNINQIVELHLDLYYDDAAVMYLNGTEIYRSIRNNLPSYAEVPWNAVMPVDTLVSVGGAEDYYVQIPAASNYCEQGCVNNGATDPVDLSLLVEGTNVFTVMAWTRPTSDLGFDLGIEVERDLGLALPDELRINELVASNSSTLFDEDGDTPDWFEIHNPSDAAISLAGWSVSDSWATWDFPAISIGAGEYLTVFASSKNRAPTNGSPLHTNFKISKEGDSLRLTDPQNLVRDDWHMLPRQIVDVSYGRALDGQPITYLSAPTPGLANADESVALDPVIRPFSNRLYTVGDPVELSIDAFDPEGTALTYSMPNNQGFSVDANGMITGTASTAGEFAFVITVADATGLTATQPVVFTIHAPPMAQAPLVLNEYNAVASDRELAAGSDLTFGQVLGNGGDWYEFVVVEDLLDLRGWSIQLWDRDRADDLMEKTAYLEFGDDFALAALRAGTIITISEDRPDDLSFDPDAGDWTLNLRASTDNPGALFAVQENFKSTRNDQQVEIRDANGALQSPLVGETEPWDQFVGGVSGGEVMNFCADPSLLVPVNPVDDYRDNAVTSSYGLENQCNYADAAGNIVQFNQNLQPLRAASNVRGDVTCDGQVNTFDALAIAQWKIGSRTDVGSCPLANMATQINLSAADFNVSDQVDLGDSLAIARCSIGIVSTYCEG